MHALSFLPPSSLGTPVPSMMILVSTKEPDFAPGALSQVGGRDPGSECVSSAEHLLHPLPWGGEARSWLEHLTRHPDTDRAGGPGRCCTEMGRRPGSHRPELPRSRHPRLLPVLTPHFQPPQNSSWGRAVHPQLSGRLPPAAGFLGSVATGQAWSGTDGHVKIVLGLEVPPPQLFS